MIRMKQSWRLGVVLAVALSCVAALADPPQGIEAPAVFTGLISAVSSTSITVQAVPLALASGTQVFGLDSGGGVGDPHAGGPGTG